MKIMFATSEAVPFIKSGGLADVSGSLAKALRSRRQSCRVVMPLYDDIDPADKAKMKFITSFTVPLSWRNQYCGVFEATEGGVKYYFLDNEYYFKRGGLYGFFDDAERFAFFSRAVLEMVNHIDFEPDVIHCNDWQTAMIPVFLNVMYRGEKKLRDIKTVFTIHNIQYQGAFPKEISGDILGLPNEHFSIVEFGNCVNFMKGALEQAEAITTVSPSYAQEILDPWYAHGMDGVLRNKQYKLTGILNGLDIQDYNPETDQKICANYSAKDLAGKAVNKWELQSQLGLSKAPDTMLLAMVTRMVSHKGVDLVQYAFSRLMKENVQLVVLGSGDWQYEKFFKEMLTSYPDRLSVNLGFNPVLARRVYSGADAFLMPSRSEPCGLAQMIALRYGTIPIVRSTGGLKDTIRDLDGEDGNGYTFLTYNADDMLYAVERACRDFEDPKRWTSHIKNAMKCDFGWGKSAGEYIALYNRLIG